jgi:hypothetical protein
VPYFSNLSFVLKPQPKKQESISYLANKKERSKDMEEIIFTG